VKLITRLIILAVTCPGIKLADLKKRNVSQDTQRAEQEFATMVESCMPPRKTSGIWLDDSPECEWLVIYAGEHIGKEGKAYRNGFMVESCSIFLSGLKISDIFRPKKPSIW
jgi:hypothetical protein